MRNAMIVVALMGVAHATSAAGDEPPRGEAPPGGEAPGAEPRRDEPPRVVVSTDTLDLAQRTFGLALDYRLGGHFAVRGALGYDRRHFDDDRLLTYTGGLQVAVGLRFFLLKAYEGPFVDAELKRREFTTHSVCNHDDSEPLFIYCDDPWLAHSLRARAGWQHTFPFRISIAAAIGIGHEWTNRADLGLGDGYSEWQFVREIRVGYAF